MASIKRIAIAAFVVLGAIVRSDAQTGKGVFIQSIRDYDSTHPGNSADDRLRGIRAQSIDCTGDGTADILMANPPALPRRTPIPVNHKPTIVDVYTAGDIMSFVKSGLGAKWVAVKCAKGASSWVYPAGQFDTELIDAANSAAIGIDLFAVHVLTDQPGPDQASALQSLYNLCYPTSGASHPIAGVIIMPDDSCYQRYKGLTSKQLKDTTSFGPYFAAAKVFQRQGVEMAYCFELDPNTADDPADPTNKPGSMGRLNFHQTFAKQAGVDTIMPRVFWGRLADMASISGTKNTLELYWNVASGKHYMKKLGKNVVPVIQCEANFGLPSRITDMSNELKQDSGNKYQPAGVGVYLLDNFSPADFCAFKGISTDFPY